VLKVESLDQGGVRQVLLQGSIDETLKFEALPAGSVTEVRFDLREVNRVTGFGGRILLKQLQDLQNQKVGATLLNCSPPVVDFLNLVTAGFSGVRVESLLVPYSCSQCRAELAATFELAVLQRAKFEIPAMVCPKCGGSAVLDDETSKYFAFQSKL
jgi:anti-anti-sigma regulatory factor